jgi:hypothetical protein
MLGKEFDTGLAHLRVRAEKELTEATASTAQRPLSISIRATKRLPGGRLGSCPEKVFAIEESGVAFEQYPG